MAPLLDDRSAAGSTRGRSRLLAHTGRLRQRQERWLRLGERALAGSVITDNGLRLIFRAAAGIETELKELTALERDCCAFATWSLHNHGDKLALDVSADSVEGIAAVQAMFATLRAGPDFR